MRPNLKQLHTSLPTHCHQTVDVTEDQIINLGLCVGGRIGSHRRSRHAREGGAGNLPILSRARASIPPTVIQVAFFVRYAEHDMVVSHLASGSKFCCCNHIGTATRYAGHGICLGTKFSRDGPGAIPSGWSANVEARPVLPPVFLPYAACRGELGRFRDVHWWKRACFADLDFSESHGARNG